MSSSADFDRSFEEIFVIPEFRAIESKSSEARAKMLSYLTTYETLPEETASQLLSNDLLLEPLRPTENEQFHEYLESALQGQNASLSEEKAALEKQFKRELAEKEGLDLMLFSFWLLLVPSKQCGVSGVGVPVHLLLYYLFYN